jgi:hypothetical protein
MQPLEPLWELWPDEVMSLTSYLNDGTQSLSGFPHFNF